MIDNPLDSNALHARLMQLALLSYQTGQCLRASGKTFQVETGNQSVAAVSAWGGGVWGILHSLVAQGPCTVPDLTRERSVSRQRIQKIVDELIALGLVTTVDNPAHKRSKHLMPTDEGRRVYRLLSEQLTNWFKAFADDFDPKEVETALRVMARLHQAVRPG